MCAKIIVECGVKKVIYDKEYNSSYSSELFKIAKLEIMQWKEDLERFI